MECKPPATPRTPPAPRRQSTDEQLERELEEKLKVRHRCSKARREEDEDDDTTTASAIDLIDRASALISEQESKQKLADAENEKLPLLCAGKVYPHDFVKNGYRVMDGCKVHYNQREDVRVSSDRVAPFEENKTNVVLTSSDDGNIPWVYYNSHFRNGEGHDLAQCIINHGLGGWHDKKRDVRCKCVYLDADRSFNPGAQSVLLQFSPVLPCRCASGLLRIVVYVCPRVRRQVLHSVHGSSSGQIPRLRERPGDEPRRRASVQVGSTPAPRKGHRASRTNQFQARTEV